MFKKNIFFTADWHIGHQKSIEYDKRPFDNLEHMHRVLINNYNASVKENDICYFLGDIGVHKTETTKAVIEQLNGTKVLILGNHDKGINALYDCGFNVILNRGALVIANELVTMSHCPIRGLYREDTSDMKGSYTGELWHGESREKYKNYSVLDEGQFHLHGHVHSPNNGRSEKILDKQYDVGVVCNKFRPVSISEIESWICKYKRGSNVN